MLTFTVEHHRLPLLSHTIECFTFMQLNDMRQKEQESVRERENAPIDMTTVTHRHSAWQ